MVEHLPFCVCRGGCLREVLLGHLLGPGAVPWPGADGLTVEEVLASYLDAAGRGVVPGREDLCRLHPGLATEVNHFFPPHPPARLLARCRSGSCPLVP